MAAPPATATNCSQYANSMPAEAPTKLAYVALPDLPGFSSVLSSCCGNNPVDTWGSQNCYLYCNVTAPGQTDQSVADCVTRTIRQSTGTQDYGIGHSSGKSSVGTQFDRGGVMGFVVMGIAFVGCVWGML